MTSPAAARKNRWGDRVYPVPRPGTLEIVELPSVTGLLDTIAKPGLEIWKQRKLAQQLSLRPDWVALAGTGEDGAKEVVRQAKEADQSAANTGTGIHYFTEQVDDGSLMWDMVPEPIRPAVAHYAQAKEDYGWELVRKEFTCYSLTHGYAGTADRFLRFPKLTTKVHTSDIKTGKGVYADYGLQMACYTFSDGIWTPGPTPLADAGAVQLEKDIKQGVNIPPTPTGKTRTKWTQAAIKAAEAELQEAYWEEYAQSGTHEPLPEDLCGEVAYVLHVTNAGFELYPLYIAELRPAVAAIVPLFEFTNAKLIVGEAVPNPAHPEPTVATPSQVTPTLSVEEFVNGPEAAVPESAQRQVSDLEEEFAAAAPEPIQTIGVEEAAALLQQAEQAGTAIPEPTEEELPPVVDEFQPEPPASIPVAAPAPAATRVQVYRDRISALSVEAKQQLAFKWPAEVPTFKKSSDQTDEQLALIDKLLWDVENEFPPSTAEQDAAVRALTNAFSGSSVE